MTTRRRHGGDVLLELDDLHVYYGNIQALKGVSLTVNRGEIVTLIGSNGAGKSTTLRAISGTHKPRTGTVKLAGQRDPAPAGARDRDLRHRPLARGAQGVQPHDGLREPPDGGLQPSRPEDRRRRRARLRPLPAAARATRRRRPGTMSGGEQQMLAMGRALMAGPTILLLDEPSMGLSPILTEQIFKIIAEINGQGTTVLLVEQNALMALNAAAPRLCHPDRQDHPGRHRGQPRRQRAGPPGVPRRDLSRWRTSPGRRAAPRATIGPTCARC